MYRGEPFDARDFEMWAKRKSGKSIPPVQRLVKDLGGRGFKVFLITGRDSDSLRTPTSENLRSQGFVAYERLIMRQADLFLSLSSLAEFFYGSSLSLSNLPLENKFLH